MEPGRNKTALLAAHARRLRLSDIPPEVVERAKHIILDEVASAFFCSRSLAGGLTARYAASAGGYPEARIYATGASVSAVNAALANGAAGHGEEVDGAHVAGGHPGASIVHACVAMAERQRTTGAQLIEAVVAGYDIGVRLVEACGGLFGVKERFQLNSDFLYAFGCAVGASKLLGLDAPQIGHGMALVSFNTNALANFYAERRHISKSLCNGQFASAGVSAALMAGCGLEGHDDVIGSDYGLLHAWGDPDRVARLGEGLGEAFAVMGANFKFINAGYPIHAAVEAAMDAFARSGVPVERIESVRVGMPTAARRVVDSRTMHNICLQDMLAAALIADGLSIRSSPFPAVLEDPRFAGLRASIELHSSEELDRDQPNGRGCIVTITAQGQSWSSRVDAPRGHATRGGVSWLDLRQKWTEGLPNADIGRIFDAAENLEDLEDVSVLLDTIIGR
jgi:2-methylcitrate dehydratase PrpD